MPLEAASDDGDPRHWWSRAYSLPAGRFRLSGTPPLGITFFNGESAFQSDDPVFETALALGRFRLRARNLFEPPRLFLLEPRRAVSRSLATVSAEGVRLHALDDEVYSDAAGFWIRMASRAAFAIELLSEESRGARILVANGGAPNVVTLDGETLQERFELAPWEERELDLPLKARVAKFEIESESGFRPQSLDPSSRDSRELGVLVRARGRLR